MSEIRPDRIRIPAKDRIQLGARVFARRTILRLSWHELHSRSGISVNSLRLLERGRGQITRPGLVRLASCLETTPEYLLAGTTEPTSKTDQVAGQQLPTFEI